VRKNGGDSILAVIVEGFDADDALQAERDGAPLH
jgi:hypothetical protein